MSMPRSEQIAPKDNIKFRRAMLKALADADRQAKTDAERWIDVETVTVITPKRRKMIAAFLLRLGIIETKVIKDLLNGNRTEAKINQHGLWALENDALFHKDMQVSMQIPRPIFVGLDDLANGLGLTRATGRGAREVASVVSLLRVITNHSEEFRRWVKAVEGL